jgi:predicted amidohydrolase YtcJ
LLSKDDAPDKILTDGAIYTMDPNEPWVSALALQDGKIMVRGSTATIAQHRSDSTEVFDLGGRMVMPGLVGGHAHPTKGAIAELFS